MSEHQYGAIRDGKVYRKALEGFPEKEIGEVKDTEEAALAYYEQRFRHLEEKVVQMEEDVHSTSNKGSYLMKLLHMKETLPDYDGLGDFRSLYERLEVLEGHIQEVINQNRKRNLEIKTALLAEGAQLQQVSNWKEASEFAKDLKMRWIKTGSLDPEHHEEYEEKFNVLIEDFFARRNAFFEDRNKLIADRVERYKELIEKARKIVAEKEAREAAGKIKALQADWKNVGSIPAPSRNELWQELQTIVKPVFEKQRKPRQEQKKEFQKPSPESLKAKKELLDQMRALQGYDKGTLDKAYALQEAFKSQGFTTGSESAAVSQEFFQALALMKEKNFLQKLAQGKAHDFSSKDEQEQIRFKLRLLRDLLGRDERELQNFQDNLAHLSTGKNKVNKMMDSKLRMQQRKVEVKRLLLQELQAQLKGN